MTITMLHKRNYLFKLKSQNKLNLWKFCPLNIILTHFHQSAVSKLPVMFYSSMFDDTKRTDYPLWLVSSTGVQFEGRNWKMYDFQTFVCSQFDR